MQDETNQATCSSPKDKAELLTHIQRAWSALMQTIEKLTPQQMTEPGTGGWSVKDNLAHLQAEDRLNALLYERNRERSVAKVLDGLQRSHEQVSVALEQMTYADLMKPRYTDDPEKRPVINWGIGNTYEHYQEHQQSIQAVVGNPFIAHASERDTA